MVEDGNAYGESVVEMSKSRRTEGARERERKEEDREIVIHIHQQQSVTRTRQIIILRLYYNISIYLQRA